MKIGDQIFSINNFCIETLEDFYKAIEMFNSALTLQIVVIRHSKSKYSLENSWRRKNISIEQLTNDNFKTTKKLRPDHFLSRKQVFYGTKRILNKSFNGLIYDNLFYPEYINFK